MLRMEELIIVSSGSGSAFSSLTGIPGFDRDDQVYVLVTPNDGTDDGVQVESDIATVLNTAPTTPTISLTSSVNPPIGGVDDLTCSVTGISTDLDGDLVTYTYEWSDGVTTHQTYANTVDTVDVFLGAGTTAGTWTCSVTASDGTAAAATSADIVVEADWSGPLFFTTCGVTGAVGPSQSDCDAEYSGGDLDGSVLVSSEIQYWEVPSDGTYSIEVYGAQGGSSGSLGAMMYGEFNLLEGDDLGIVVGQEGTGSSSHAGGVVGFVWMSSNTSLLIAAGGGGGEGAMMNNTDEHGTTSTSGNNGGEGFGWGGVIRVLAVQMDPVVLAVQVEMEVLILVEAVAGFPMEHQALPVVLAV